MKPTVMKFGGTSVEDATAFGNVAAIVARAVGKQEGVRPVVVVSAMSGFTDALLSSVQQAISGNAGGALRDLDQHFARHQKVLDALVRAEPRGHLSVVGAKPDRDWNSTRNRRR